MKNFTRLILLAVLFSLSISVQSQTFTLVPGEFITQNITMEFYNNIQVDMHHPGHDDITFGWVTLDVDFPKEWTFESCDNGGCYGQLPDSAMVGPLPDSVPGYIRITINPWKAEGVGTAKIYIYNTKFPDDGKIVEFEIIATEITSVAEKIISPMEIYPNPATEWLILKNPNNVEASFEMIDMTGKALLSDFVAPNQQQTIQLFDLPKGIYFIRYHYEKDFQTQKVIIQ